ncbi:MAG: type I-C CRISPR-associated protein Cas7/Csd2 [Oscillospiraceae bacterium]
MSALEHRVDFMALISVTGANPNGDPCGGGVPRTDSRGCGVITPVCIKRKLRDRLGEAGENILVSPPEGRGDSLAARIRWLPRGSELTWRACAEWYDVRAFGQVFAFPGVSATGIKGAVTLQQAVSVCPLKIVRTGITRCIANTENNRSSMGFIRTVDYGLYLLKGSVNAYIARKNGFTQEDCWKLRAALLHIFDNDCSASRPAGSMELSRLYWWEHSCALGDYPPAKVFGSVSVRPLIDQPLRFQDHEVIHTPLPGLDPEIYEG